MDHGSQDAAGFRWTFGRAEFDESRWELRVEGRPVELERKPLELLAQLLRHAGEVLTKDELLESVWTGRVVVEAALTNAIGKLRKALGDETQSLLVTVPRVGYRLDGPVSRKAVQALPPASLLAAGDAVPRRANYRLVERLARNEDSEVWRAQQPKTHEERVFKFSLDGARLPGLKREVTLARLLRDALGEREEFVRVLDWDFEQAPYFIESEYGGSSLDAWFGQHGDAIDRSQRLALVAQIADAVASAHEVGVLHKDLKPANILVYGQPGDWRPRLTDFGSGRVLDAGHLEALGITELGLTRTQNMTSDSRSGTPLYLAPEVIAGQSPSIKSDLYALGVILYQLLAGDFRRPMSPGWESDIDDALLRQDIADFANGDPAKRPPSARVLSERLTTLDARRVQLDLEQAVQARIAESERKLARTRARRPWVAAAMLALCVGLVATGSMYRQARQSQDHALEQRDIAQSLNRFVIRDILGSANPFDAGSATVTMRDALDRGARSVEARFGSRPELAAPMHETVAHAYYQLSEYAKAEQNFRKASAAFRSAKGPSDPSALTNAALAIEAAARRGNVDNARAGLGALRQQIGGAPAASRPLLTAYVDRATAWAAFAELDYKRAIAPLEHAAAQLALIPEVDPDFEASIHQALLMARAQAGLPPADLIQLQRTALAGLNASNGERKMSMSLSARYALARMRMLAGEERTLEAEYRAIIEELGRVMGPVNENTLLAMHGLSHIYFKQEKWPACTALATKAEWSLRELMGPSHTSSINAANTLGACLLGEGRIDSARAVLLRALAGTHGNAGMAGKYLRVAVQINLAHIAIAKADWKQASSLLGQIRANGGTLLKADTDAEGEVALIDGQIRAGRGETASARQWLSESVRLLSLKNPPGYWLIRSGQRSLAALSGPSTAVVGSMSRPN